MCTDRQAEVSPEKIREAAWELWQEVVDGSMSENYPIEEYDEIVKKIIKVLYQEEEGQFG